MDIMRLAPELTADSENQSQKITKSQKSQEISRGKRNAIYLLY